MLGNPPWERIKLQEKEFFGSRDPEIATAQNKAEREKLIKTLPERKPELARAFKEAKHEAEAQSKFIRESNRFPLTAVGDINTYAIFAETVREIINQQGRTGVIVPTGIATDNTTKDFFGDLIKKQNLASLYDFENREKIFISIASEIKFSLLIMSKSKIEEAKFSFFLIQPKQLDDERKVFTLALQDITLINPNTLNCPVFRTKVDAEITKKIYQLIPIWENETRNINTWGISFMRMFDMSGDSHLFKNEPLLGLLPLYEAKMFHQFDHRFGYYTEDMIKSENNTFRAIPDPTIKQKQDYSFTVNSRYWIDNNEVKNRLSSKWDKDYLLGFRGICRSVDLRTAIFAILPKVAVGHKAPLIFIDIKHISKICCLLGNFCSLVFDFVTRQKMGGTDLSYFILKQLPIIPPESYTPQDIEFISS